MIAELRLPRDIAALWVLHRAMPAGAYVILVRYTKTELVCLYRA
jgi:hypothetical protein